MSQDPDRLTSIKEELSDVDGLLSAHFVTLDDDVQSWLGPGEADPAKLQNQVRRSLKMFSRYAEGWTVWAFEGDDGPVVMRAVSSEEVLVAIGDRSANISEILLTLARVGKMLGCEIPPPQGDWTPPIDSHGIRGDALPWTPYHAGSDRSCPQKWGFSVSSGCRANASQRSGRRATCR